MEYSALFSRGWGITWRNKWMWLLAFIPAVAGLVTFGFSAGQQGMMAGGVAYGTGAVLLLSCLRFIVAFLIFLIGLATRGGLIAAVDGVDRGESYSFGRALGDGRRKVWPLLGMSLLLFGGFGILVALGVALIVAGSFFAVRESIRHGWKVLRENLGEIVLLAVPFFLLCALLAGLYSVVALGGSVTAILSGDPAAAMNAFSWRFIVLYVIWSLIYAVLLAWQSATFTLGYRSWTGKGALEDEDIFGAAWTP